MTHDECADLQDDELVALQAIFPPDQVRIEAQRTDDCKGASPVEAEVGAEAGPSRPRASLRRSPTDSRHRHRRRVHFSIPVCLAKPIEVDVNAASSSSSVAEAARLTLLHLPPLHLDVSLATRYPLEEAPTIERLSAPWVTTAAQRDWLARRLAEQWEEVQAEVLWTWAEWLKEGWVDEALTAARGKSPESCPFAASQGGGGPRSRTTASLVLHDTATPATNTVTAAKSLAQTLEAYDRLSRQSAFGKERFLCGICLEAKRGEACTRVQGCGHVFCRECLGDYLTLHLTEGSLTLAQSCPDPSCMTLRSRAAAGAGQAAAVPALTQTGVADASGIADPSSLGTITVQELEDFLKASSQPQLVERLHFLQEKEAAEADPTAVPCPRMDCQTLTGARQEDRGSASRWEAFRQCGKCGMSFCVWCRKTWHAPSPCSLSSTGTLIARYEAASVQERRAMEVRYGRKNLLRLKAQYEEDRANQDWLRSKTQSCPHCGSSIEKAQGCNHMHCTHCATHFCYLCGTRLNAAQPYVHFNTPGSRCYNRLFDGILGDGGGGGDGGEDDAGNAGAGPDEEMNEEQRREQEQHMMALAAIQAAFSDDEDEGGQ